uniref:Uncharacterized protein n=1 Tax=Anguilla anguilla TaxID=7936 RepID=A0A0E9T1Z1_ANGAN
MICRWNLRGQTLCCLGGDAGIQRSGGFLSKD